MSLPRPLGFKPAPSPDTVSGGRASDGPSHQILDRRPTLSVLLDPGPSALLVRPTRSWADGLPCPSYQLLGCRLTLSVLPDPGLSAHLDVDVEASAEPPSRQHRAAPASGRERKLLVDGHVVVGGGATVAHRQRPHEFGDRCISEVRIRGGFLLVQLPVHRLGMGIARTRKLTDS